MTEKTVFQQAMEQTLTKMSSAAKAARDHALMFNNKRVKLICHVNTVGIKDHSQGAVEAAVVLVCNNLVINKGTLDFCISYIDDRKFELVNACEVLYWLHKNAEFVPYRNHLNSMP